MIKQIDRVIGDLVRQVDEFRKAGGNPICVGLVGINYAGTYTSYEGDRIGPTDGRKHKHPIQEAAVAEQRLRDRALPSFDEFLLLRFRAGNVEPSPSSGWVTTKPPKNTPRCSCASRGSTTSGSAPKGQFW